MTKLVRSRDIVEGCIGDQLNDFYETNNMEQKHNKFSIVEAENRNNLILTVEWKFSQTDKL